GSMGIGGGRKGEVRQRKNRPAHHRAEAVPMMRMQRHFRPRLAGSHRQQLDVRVLGKSVLFEPELECIDRFGVGAGGKSWGQLVAHRAPKLFDLAASAWPARPIKNACRLASKNFSSNASRSDVSQSSSAKGRCALKAPSSATLSVFRLGNWLASTASGTISVPPGRNM